MLDYRESDRDSELSRNFDRADKLVNIDPLEYATIQKAPSKQNTEKRVLPVLELVGTVEKQGDSKSAEDNSATRKERFDVVVNANRSVKKTDADGRIVMQMSPGDRRLESNCHGQFHLV